MINFIFAIMVNFSFDTTGHQVVAVPELLQLLGAESKTRFNFDKQLPTNGAFVYYVSNGRVVLLPNNMPPEGFGLLFANREAYNECLAKDRFPIDNPDMPIFEKHQSDILDIRSKMNSILHDLDILVNKKPTVDSFNVEAIADLLLQLRRQKKLSLKNKLFTALALGEYLRIVNGGKWLVIKRYGVFNPYYLPAIIYPNNHFVQVLDEFNFYFNNKDLPLEKFANWPQIKEPVHNFENNHFSDYKILD